MIAGAASAAVHDGAAALLIASETAIAKHGLRPIARILGGATAGVPPRIMVIGPAPASQKLMARLGLTQSNFDVIELNEAFAAQGIATLRQLGIADDDPRVNPNGGAIALGHPLGMSGARITGTAALELAATGGRRALSTMCIGVGQGIAIALRTDLPQIVFPTTYAGSEATGILGQTENGRKTTITTPKVQPEVILYDAELVRTPPVAITVTSALNAMAHAAEGLYAQNRSPLSTLMAIEGLRAFRDALPRVLDNPDDLTARGETLYGAWLCGTVLGTVGMALHHKLCHTLGGSFDLPHAETHSIILPHAIAYNETAAARELAPIADLFGAPTPGRSLHGFATRMRAPTALRDIGMKEADLDCATDLATQNPYWNPRPVEPKALRRLLQNAWEGRKPDNQSISQLNRAAETSGRFQNGCSSPQSSRLPALATHAAPSAVRSNPWRGPPNCRRPAAPPIRAVQGKPSSPSCSRRSTPLRNCSLRQIRRGSESGGV